MFKLDSYLIYRSRTVPRDDNENENFLTRTSSLARLPSPKLGEGLGVRAYFHRRENEL
jgi:hypothetical protein